LSKVKRIKIADFDFLLLSNDIIDSLNQFGLEIGHHRYATLAGAWLLFPLRELFAVILIGLLDIKLIYYVKMDFRDHNRL
jgi:hypothetical protein